MLERATACVEPAAHHLLRRFEIPTRTSRILRQSFWKHGGDELVGPAWWPEYLHNVRRLSQTRLEAERDVLIDIGSSALSGMEGTGRYLGMPILRSHVQETRFTMELQSRFNVSQQDRSYSRSCRKFAGEVRQTKIAQCEAGSNGTDNTKGGMPRPIHDPAGHGEATNIPAGKMGTPHKDMTSSADPTQNQAIEPSQPKPVYSNREQFLSLLQERQDAFGEAWRLFISLEAPETCARRMLQYLSKSESRIDAERGLRAYQMLSVEQKKERTYATAMRIANSRRNKRLALEINREALSRSLGGEPSKILFGFLVRNNLWITLAQALDDILSTQTRHGAPSNHRDHQQLQRSHQLTEQDDRFWNQIWAEVDEMDQLLEKVLSLMRRIERASPESQLQEPRAKRLAVYLLYRIIGNPRVMGVINAKGFLSIFQKYAKAELLSPNHYYQAIRTLHAMTESRNKSQLAALAYRNLRFRFPSTQVPRWIFGCLISIFTDAAQPAHAVRFLLEEFVSMYGRADPKAYQKVMVACARLGDVAGVYEVFHQFSKTHGPPQDLGYITPLLYVHARLGDVASTQAQFDRLKSDFNIDPDIYCWNILLAAHARARDTTGAFDIFQDMQRLGVKPNTRTFGTLMGICANNGDTEAVYKLVDMARRENVSGTTAMVDTLVHSYCLNDEPESAKDLVEAATKRHLEGSPTRMWNTLLRHYAFQADPEAVLRVQERMRELSVKPDEMTYAALMTTLVVIGKTHEAAQILRSLHFNRHLTATLFHYSIVLHGFATEGNRDMVSVIYNEILERFPRPSVSARLAVLNVKAGNDRTTWRTRRLKDATDTRVLQLPRASDFLADVLLELSQADIATKEPQPGFQRRSTVEALPLIYMEFLINTLNSAGAFSKAEQLLSRCQSLINTSPLSDPDKTRSSIQLLTAHMTGCIKRKEFTRVDNCWSLIFAKALSRGRHRVRSPHSTVKDSEVAVDPPPPSPTVNIGLPKSDNLFASGTSLPSGVGEDDAPSVFPSQRYLLAAPINRYMQALGAQDLVSLVPDLVGKLEKAGFALNSKNYNTYVQVLTQSANPEHHIQAFRIFEEKLLPNMPPWPLLRRGKWIPPSGFDQKEQRIDSDLQPKAVLESELEPEPVPRKLLEKFRPGQLVPTYYTMVFLGSALMRFQRRGTKDEVMTLRHLRLCAPRTVQAVLQLPYVRDRIQGLLLRGREVKGDLVKRPRRPPVPDRAGLRGSKSPLDHIPVDSIFDNPVPNVVLGVKGKTSSNYTSRYPRGLRTHDGEILRGPALMERRGRLETDSEYRDRVHREEQEKSATLEQMRADAKKARVVSDVYFGEPHIGSTNFKTQDQTFTRKPVQKPTNVSQRQAVPGDQRAESLEPGVQDAGRDGSLRPPSPRSRHGKGENLRKRKRNPPRSKDHPSHSMGSRSFDLQFLTLFKPRIRPTRRQSQAFSLRKRSRQREKLLRQREIAIQSRTNCSPEDSTLGKNREPDALLRENHGPSS